MFLIEQGTNAGSDGALAWQDFKTSGIHRTSYSTAPNMPMKKLDRVGMRMKSIHDERKVENDLRRRSGEDLIGVGYREFKRKNDVEERREEKKLNMIQSRTRPDGVKYFIPSKSFLGWKKDYVFTTRKNYGTGYYWDGTDGLRELDEAGSLENIDSTGADEKIHKRTKLGKDKTKKKKKKSNKDNGHSLEVEDAKNPFQQVADAIARRNAAITKSSTGTQDEASKLAAAGWSVVKDPSSGKNYYYHNVSKETKWDNPLQNSLEAHDSTVVGAATCISKDVLLPQGWKECIDEKSGNTYYYHQNGTTSWNRPTGL